MPVIDKYRHFAVRIIGLVGTLVCIGLFARSPSFPTPDKIFIFLLFVFMVFDQTIEMVKRLLPFVAILLAYESFRGVVTKLNSHVHYSFAPHIDRWLFGNLPTVYLQNLLWKGHTSWYDFVFYFAYMLHFVLPLGLAILVWKTREKEYWRVITTYLLVSFAGFFTFLLFPAAPPWLASQNNYIQPIARISTDVWFGLGLKDFPSFYNHITPNPVAAIPSLHSAWATLLVIFVFKFYGKRWAALAAVYPFLIFMGTIYEGEHYAFDVIAGIVYAVLGYLLAPKLLAKIQKMGSQLPAFKLGYSSNTKNASKSKQ
jgi:membrane-associated phospholipid phosphatase